MEDPIIHFYETFLSEYDPKLRKSRGVWYTPQPVVNFIVRAVDNILKTEFDLPQGLADTSKTKIKVNTDIADKNYKGGYRTVEQEVHKVQILDPATGTGTFLAEVIKHIHKKFKGQQGIWSNYVEQHLIPRLNGFELLMASYAMAHLKLDLLLKETGYNTTPPSGHPSKGGEFRGGGQQRLRVYLTNSLEEHHQDTGTLFANWLSTEANEANHIKRDTPVMCVIGNPPYAVSSTNKNDWIDNLIADYKKDLNEKSYNSLSDDYVKFIRYGQHYIEKNGSGVLAYISNNSFVDGIVFRKMRENLLECFDKIYILDLHGNSKKKEVCPDGSSDVNVFDIQQGVSINIFVKTDRKKKNELGKLFQFDLYGKRDFKYDFLNEHNFGSLKWNTPSLNKPNYFFTNMNYKGQDNYKKGFSIDDLFQIKAAGIKTHRDSVVIGFNKKELKEQIENYDASTNPYTESKVKSISYRPFDNRLIYFDTELVTRHREKQIRHSFFKNISLLCGRQTKNKEVCQFFISNTLSEMKTAESSTGSYHFQLYTYPESNGQQKIEQTDTSASSVQGRTPNLKAEIVNQIAENLGLTFVPEKSSSHDSPPFEEGCPEGGVVKKEYNKISNLPNLKTFRKKLRNNLTPAEATLWKVLKGKQLEGRKFRRQHSMGNYILDFYCPTERLAIELDGQGHFEASQAEYDLERDLFLEHFGIKVLRYENKLVWNNLDGILDEVKSNFGKQPLSPADSSPFEGEQLEEFAPIDILDYIYAVLHSPTYREKYKEFLKIDFPRVPYPKDQDTFWQLVKLGGEIRQIHLLESPKVEQYITQYPIDGDNEVTRKFTKSSPGFVASVSSSAVENKEDVFGKVYINDTQYFDNVPLVAWEFYIGGYQPAQKWLKDRKDRKLEFDDILHYQKIIVALTEADRIMKEIDDIQIE